MSGEIQEVANGWNWNAISAVITLGAVIGAFGVAWYAHHLAQIRTSQERAQRRKAALQMIYQEVRQLDHFFTAIEFADKPAESEKDRRVLGKIAYGESDFDPKLPDVLADTRFELVVALGGEEGRHYAIAAARRREIIRLLKMVLKKAVVPDEHLAHLLPVYYQVVNSDRLPSVMQSVQRAAEEGYHATRYLMAKAEEEDPALTRQPGGPG